MINYENIAKATVSTEPFPYVTVKDVINRENLEQVQKDFPVINAPGIFPLSDLSYGHDFSRLIEEIKSIRLANIIEEKFSIKLSDKPLMITVRGFCRSRDGHIHNDSKDKLVTCLLYLNAPEWDCEGGRLRLLRDAYNLDNMIAEVPPCGGNFLAFKRTENSWHGHAPYEGPRRYIMFNWLASEATYAKNIGRHKLSAIFKKSGLLKNSY